VTTTNNDISNIKKGDVNNMKVILSMILIISTVFFIDFMIPLEASAADFSCYIRAGRSDTYVVVTDMDRDGNPIRRRGETWQGWIKQGQSQALKSRFGKIRYNYRRMNESRGRGRVFANCRSGNTIQLP
jgi:hypothetical protein